MKLLIFLLCLLPTISKAQISLETLSLGAGSFTPFVNRIQTDDNGGTRFIDFNLVLSAGAQIKLYDAFSFRPSIVSTLPKSSDRDENISKLYYFLNFPLAYTYQNAVFFLGPSLGFTYISSDGGDAILPNGTVSGDSFPLPNGSSTTRNLLVNLGMEYVFLKDYSFKGEVSIYNLFGEYNRAVSYFLTLNMFFDSPFE